MTRARRLRQGPVVVTIAYLLSAFGWRTWHQWRTTGDSGVRIQAESPSERVASGLITVGVVAGLVAVARDRRPAARTRRAGIGIMAAATAVTVAAQLDMGSSWRIGVDTDERTDLVTGGFFSVVRNPIFSAMSAFALGAVMAVPGRLSAAAASALIAGIEVQVRAVEEPYLLSTHGDDYERYASRVGRFLPGVGRLR